MKAAIALALGISCLAARPEVRPRPLEDLVRFSEWVVVGRVEHVIEIAHQTPLIREPGDVQHWSDGRTSIPIAEVAVIRTLHGPPIERLFYLACGTWTCDISEAVVGETAVFFLDDSRWLARDDTISPSSLAELVRAAPLLQLALAGRGCMPLREIDGRSYAEHWANDVILPDVMPTIASPAPDSDYLRCVSVDVLEGFVREESKRVLPMMRSWFWPANANSRSAPWSISVWNDGVAFVTDVAKDSWGSKLQRPAATSRGTWLAQMASAASDPRLDALLLPYADEPVRFLEFRSNERAWRVGDRVLDSSIPWTGDELELVQRLRDQYARLDDEAHRPIRTDD